MVSTGSVLDISTPSELTDHDQRLADRGEAGSRKASATGMLWTWLVLALSLLLTAVTSYTLKSDGEKAALDQFELRSGEIVHQIDRRMIVYAEMLRAGLGLFKASGTVTRDEWRIYVEALNLDKLFPGIQGLGYAEWIRPADRESYEAAIRAEGFADFTIRPPGQREIYTSITYLEPFDRRNRQAFGYDMFSQETRRRAMELARDSGEIAISGAVRLVQEISEDVQAGFLMYAPFYARADSPDSVEERRDAIVGFVYSPFRMRNLMEGILGPGLPNVRLQIYDGDRIEPEALMYDSQPQSTHDRPTFVHSELLDVGQHGWTLKFSTLPAFEKRLDVQKVYIILGAGILTSLLIFCVLWSFATTRQRAQALAAKMTVELDAHSRELARSNEDLEQFAYVASHDLKAPLRGIDHLAAWIESDLGDQLTGEPLENMKRLRGRIKRLEALLNDLLNYSRASRTEAAIENVNLKELVRGIFDLLNVEQRFDLEFDAEIESIATRRTALEQVITNLVSNAFKHQDLARGTLFVSVRDTGRFYEFVVADDGPGVPAELRERAFQMFQTLQPRDKVEGSGMGLAIIRKIIEHMGGRIVLMDRPGGRGAQFQFYWPKFDKRQSES